MDDDDDDAIPPPDTTTVTSQLDGSVDFDVIDELLLSGGHWWGVDFLPDCFHLGASTSPNSFDPPYRLSTTPFGNISSNTFQFENLEIASGEDWVDSSPNPSFAGCDAALQCHPFEHGTVESDEIRTNFGKGSSVQERLEYAVRHIKESHQNRDVLVQIWVPEIKGDRLVLTTSSQPFRLDPTCQRLVNYRTISTNYHFSAEVSSSEVLGLPGRVFVGKVPEWTPDVRFFSIHEYARVNFAQHFDVRGSIALPIFDRHSKSCLAVLEVVMTTEKINYSSDIEKICKALQAVDLGSSEILSVPGLEVRNDSYQAALPEIQEVLRIACLEHKLPLAQTWIPCSQQGKSGRRHSISNYKECISTIDFACYVNDPSVFSFLEACSEHHLFKGQGVAGKAFTTNQPCFSSDVTCFSKIEYPLAHHAKMFKLRGAVAIRLRSFHTGAADFVLEFFLPINCVSIEEQKLMLTSLSCTIQQVCWSLRVVTLKELECVRTSNDSDEISEAGLLGKKVVEVERNTNMEKIPIVVEQDPMYHIAESPWNACTMETPEKDENIILHNVEVDSERRNDPGLSVTTQWDNIAMDSQRRKTFAELIQNEQGLVIETNECRTPAPSQVRIPKSSNATEKKSARTEKYISLQVLQRHFASSLKDAAKSVGVCPTTLKRICRQQGITRWPSRKIKKVSHSLRKLQVVHAESVEGAERKFPFGSFYANLLSSDACDPELIAQGIPAESNFTKVRQGDQRELDAENGVFGAHASTSNSPSSYSPISSNQFSSGGSKHLARTTQIAVKSVIFTEENNNKMLKEARNEVKLHPSSPESPSFPFREQKPTFLHKQHTVAENPAFPHQDIKVRDLFRVKIIYGEEKVRLRLLPAWGFLDLKQEIAKRFNISGNLIALKYLDDDSEFVLLTCDADLQECVDVYKSSNTRIIRIWMNLVQSTSTNLSVCKKKVTSS